MSQDQNHLENRPKPFSKERTKHTVGMIVYFYSVFYVIMKIVSMVQEGDYFSKLIISLPFIVLGIIGLRLKTNNAFSWVYSIMGVVVISAIRYYEIDLLTYLQELI